MGVGPVPVEAFKCFGGNSRCAFYNLRKVIFSNHTFGGNNRLTLNVALVIDSCNANHDAVGG
jgi:hypothetical protein